MMYKDSRIEDVSNESISNISDLYTKEELESLKSIKDKEELKQAVSDIDKHILANCEIESCMGENDVVTGIHDDRIEGYAELQVYRFDTREDLNSYLGDVTFSMDKDGNNISIESLNVEPSDMDLFNFSEEDIIFELYDNLNVNFDIDQEIQSFKDKEKDLDSVLGNAKNVQTATFNQTDIDGLESKEKDDPER